MKNMIQALKDRKEKLLIFLGAMLLAIGLCSLKSPNLSQATVPIFVPSYSQGIELPKTDGSNPPVAILKDSQLPLIELNSKNTVVMRNVVDAQSVATLENQLLKLSNSLPKNAEIYLVLNTPGGSVDAGLQLIDMINGLPQKVNTITVFAASMGFHIVEHLNKRYILPNGILMSHRARGQVSGQIPGELTTRANFYLRSLDMEDSFVAARLGMNLPQYRALIQDEYWVTGADAIKDHAADQMALARCGGDLNGEEVSQLLTIFGTINLTYSKCPLIGEPLKVSFDGSKDNLEKLQDIAQSYLHDKAKFIHEYLTPQVFSTLQN